jgi:hypothetical protein
MTSTRRGSRIARLAVETLDDRVVPASLVLGHAVHHFMQFPFRTVSVHTSTSANVSVTARESPGSTFSTTHNFGTAILKDGERVIAFGSPAGNAVVAGTSGGTFLGPTPTFQNNTVVIPTFNYGVATLNKGSIVMAR